MTGDSLSLEDYLGKFNAILAEVRDQKTLIKEVVRSICSDRDRVIVCTGLGKSLIMADRFAASLRSVGFRAFSLSGAEMAHGDMGALRGFESFIVLFSNSGETIEMIELLSRLDLERNLLLSITGKVDSTLAKRSNWVITARQGYSGDFGNFLPTLSLTQASMYCDIILMEICDLLSISPQDFLNNHYSGNLGMSLSKSVLNVMISRDKCALVASDERIERVAERLTLNGSGLAIVESFEDNSVTFVGVISDGDIRKFLSTGEITKFNTAEEACTRDPLTISKDGTIAEALTLMTSNKKKAVSAIPVIDDSTVVGVVTMKDIVKYRNLNKQNDKFNS